MDETLQFRVLGPLEVMRDGRPVDVGGGRQRALLARLVIEAGKVVSVDRLVDDLWGERPPASAGQTLQSYVSRLRRLLEPQRAPGTPSVLASEPPGYVLRADPHQVDTRRFQELAEHGHAALAEGRYEDAHRTLTEALGLWRGNALADVAYEPFAEPYASRLESERLAAVEDQLEAALALGYHAALTPTLEALVAAHPLRERFRAQLVVALYRSGRQAEALEALRETRRMMREELGIDPSPRLRQLESQILNQDPELEWQPPTGAYAAGPATATATFLFTDVEGSTRLLQNLGDERFGDVIAEHDALLRRAFTNRGGVENDTQGDSFFFVFADAASAVEAAVDAQRALAEHPWPGGCDVRVRVGIHTGEASVLEGKHLGLAVHRAARICDAGHGGQILLSQATANLVGGLPHALRDLGEHRLKDLERPLRLYQLVVPELQAEFPPLRSLSSGPELPTGIPAGGLTFVGREAELDQLRGALEEALSGSGRIALVEGEPGIGKSRLALEVAAAAAERGVPLLFGSCYEGGWAATLWPWVQVLRRAAELMTDDERAALAPELAQLLPELGGREPSVPGDADARSRLYDGAVEALGALARRRPLLVVIDDLHWADAPSLQLLQAAALRVVTLPVLLLGTFRQDEPGVAESLAAPLAAVSRYPWTRRIALAGLGHDAVRQVIRDTAETEPSRTLVSVVHTRTAGNPFFVTELVRLLASEGDLGDERPLYTGIPLGVRDVVRRRLLTLPAESRTLLELAAAIGREFDLPLLARASALDAASCAETIEPALHSGLVVEGTGGGLRFSHGLVRETIVEDLTPMRRARVHGHVADALRELYGDDDDDYAEQIAEHLWQASDLVDPATAEAALERAAAVAIRRHAYETGEPLLERAARLARRLPRAQRDEAELRIELELASLRMMTRGYAAPAVLEGFERVHEIARRSGRLFEVVKALHGMASAFAVAGQFGRCHKVAIECLAAAEELGEPAALAVGHLMVGIGDMHLGSITEARHHFAASIEEFDRSREEARDAFEVAVPLSLAGPVFGSIVEWIGGDAETARELRERAIDAAEELDVPFGRQVAAFFCAFLSALEDDPGGARAYLARGRDAVGEHVFPVYAVVTAVLDAWARGREHEAGAREELEGILRRLEASGVRTLSHFFHALHADLVAAQADAEEALAAFERAIEVSDALEERFYLAELKRRRGELLVRLGRPEEGTAEVAAAAELAHEQGAYGLEGKAIETLAALRGAPAG